MVITIFGLGFVGLTTALGFAEIGHKVYGVEVNGQRMKTIASGRLPFLEPELDRALPRHLKGGRFIPCTDLKAAVAESDFIYFCVGTPYGEDGQADLTYLYKAVEQSLDCVKDGKFRVLVTKSTIPPSTTSSKIIPFIRKLGFRPGERIGVANNPEFLREGRCWDDFMHPDRIVLGVSDERSSAMLRELYAPMKVPVFCVSLNTGEFIKYLSNTLLATLISYSNEMSVVADAIGGIDVAQAFRILLMDKRWGDGNMKTYAYPGCGYGGYCLPKDTNALYAVSKTAGFDAHILENVIRTNDNMPAFMVKRIEKAAERNPEKTVGILGLSFKPGSDDTRDAPSAKIIRALNGGGYRRIVAYDPVAMDEFQQYYRDMAYTCVPSYEDAVKQADVLVIATAWPDFADLPKRTDKPIVDCRYML